MSLRHPWAPGVGLARPSLGPNQLAIVEFALEAVAGLGLDVDAMMGMAAMLTAFVRGFVQGELAELDARRRTGMTEDQWRQSMAPYMRQIVESGRYPQLNRYIIEGDDDVEPELAFEQGLDRLLVGLAATLPARSGPA